MSELTVPETDTAALDRAADIIQRNGWHRGHYFAETVGLVPEACPVCAEGAINIAVYGQPERTPYWQNTSRRLFRLYRIVERYLGVDDLADWNDAEERTVDEVVAALKGAARAERERLAPPA